MTGDGPSDRIQFAPCPPGCAVPADLHRHFLREPGAYFRLAEPLSCCGREWMRPDEVTVFDVCQWCLDEGVQPLSTAARLIYPVGSPVRRRRPWPDLSSKSPPPTGCAWSESGMWIHHSPHDCPTWIRGRR